MMNTNKYHMRILVGDCLSCLEETWKLKYPTLQKRSFNLMIFAMEQSVQSSPNYCPGSQ